MAVEHGSMLCSLYPPVLASSSRDLCKTENAELSEMHRSLRAGGASSPWGRLIRVSVIFRPSITDYEQNKHLDYFENNAQIAQSETIMMSVGGAWTS